MYFLKSTLIECLMSICAFLKFNFILSCYHEDIIITDDSIHVYQNDPLSFILIINYFSLTVVFCIFLPKLYLQNPYASQRVTLKFPDR